MLRRGTRLTPEPDSSGILFSRTIRQGEVIAYIAELEYHRLPSPVIAYPPVAAYPARHGLPSLVAAYPLSSPPTLSRCRLPSLVAAYPLSSLNA